jgi:hypothetical protein
MSVRGSRLSFYTAGWCRGLDGVGTGQVGMVWQWPFRPSPEAMLFLAVWRRRKVKTHWKPMCEWMMRRKTREASTAGLMLPAAKGASVNGTRPIETSRSKLQ